jgi:hypothetical protein
MWLWLDASDRETRVQAGSNTSTVTLRVVGGDEKASLKCETVHYRREYHGTRTREILHWREPAEYTKGRPILSSERAPHKKKDRNCQTIINIWSWAPNGARLQDLLTDWPSVAMWLWLWLDATEHTTVVTSEGSSFGMPACWDISFGAAGDRIQIVGGRRWLIRDGKKEIRVWQGDFMCDLKLEWNCNKSVAKIRLMKTEEPSACVTVKWKVCKSAIALYRL